MIVISVLHLCDMFTYIDNSWSIDIWGVKEYDMVRFPTIRERTVYRIVMTKFRSSTMFSMK